MRIAIASGKGGTGKSSLSVSLASLLSRTEGGVTLYDCDVEEPNCHLLLPGILPDESRISIQVPGLSAPDSCSECGKCARVCRFNALAALKTKPLIFPELCHSCGGCLLACPENALSWVQYYPGIIRKSRVDGIELIQGVMNVAEAQATRIIRELLKEPGKEDIQILDAPPGTSCSFMETVGSSDFILLITEPTPFGLHDLTLAVDAIAPLGIPYGIVENKSEAKVDLISEYCRQGGHPLLLSIPYKREIAETYSRGEIPFHEIPGIAEGLKRLIAEIRRLTA